MFEKGMGLCGFLYCYVGRCFFSLRLRRWCQRIFWIHSTTGTDGHFVVLEAGRQGNRFGGVILSVPALAKPFLFWPKMSF